MTIINGPKSGGRSEGPQLVPYGQDNMRLLKKSCHSREGGNLPHQDALDPRFREDDIRFSPLFQQSHNIKTVREDPEKVLASLKERSKVLNELEKNGLVARSDVKDIQKQLRKAIRDLEGLLNA